MISNELLSTLCCPETKQELSVAGTSLIEKINEKIAVRGIKTRTGAEIAQKIESGLIRTDKQYLYAIRGGIPIMLIDEAIPLAGLL
jgi:uncharacterized protein YbaR (Trm112 family)